MLNVKKIVAAGIMSVVISVAGTNDAMAESQYDQWAVDSSWEAYVEVAPFEGSSSYYHYYAHEYTKYGYVFAYYADYYNDPEYWFYAAVFNYYGYFNAFLAAEQDLAAGAWAPQSVRARDEAYEAYVACVYAYNFFQ